MGSTLPLLPLRDIVLFPHMVTPLFVGRERSIAALEEAMNGEKTIILAAQKNARTNDPAPEDIHTIATLGTIVQMLVMPDDTLKVIVEGRERVEITRHIEGDKFHQVEFKPFMHSPEDHKRQEVQALARAVLSGFNAYAKMNTRIPQELVQQVQMIEDSGKLGDVVVSHLTTVRVEDRQVVLEERSLDVRLEKILEHLNSEIEKTQLDKKIRSRVKKQMDKTQREYYLNEQMQAIQRELGEKDEFRAELIEIEEKIKTKKLNDEAKQKMSRELKKLKMMQPMSAEATVVRGYIDWVLALPWKEKSLENINLKDAEMVLNQDHYGLEKPKARILEHLAVLALHEKIKGPVLCFVGPPGVGKTSLAKSIAHAMKRNFVRLALGGVRDEAEIRGHRRTYIGAMPGRIIQSLRKAGTDNPVFLLDEVDKMSSDFRGDPAAALLEVLDPEQNYAFNDHYLDLDYDLSDVMFITTANSLSGIPLPLLDRMEVIDLGGYTEQEKLEIAKSYLIPRQKEAAGLNDHALHFSDKAVRSVIQFYTRESGVRNLEREIGNVCRKLAKEVVDERDASKGSSAGKKKAKTNVTTFNITADLVSKYLGVSKYRPDQLATSDQVGLVQGLSVSSYGGNVLECEANATTGTGKILMTGLLSDGMKESAQAALTYIRSRSELLGLPADFYEKKDLHVHFPEYIHKDGPSAGVTIATSIVSALTQFKVRRDVAMTGEITLRGRVLPIGGLKDKCLAAFRAGIKTVVCPMENKKDIKEIPHEVLSEMRLVFVEHMDEVLKEAIHFPDTTAFKKKAESLKSLECDHGEWNRSESKIKKQEDEFVEHLPEAIMKKKLSKLPVAKLPSSRS